MLESTQNQTGNMVTISRGDYDLLIKAAGLQGQVGIEQPNNDGLRPLEKLSDATTVNPQVAAEDQAVPVVKNQGKTPRKAPKTEQEKALKDGDTYSTKQNLDPNEYLAGKSMEKVPVVVADPRDPDRPDLESNKS